MFKKTLKNIVLGVLMALCMVLPTVFFENQETITESPVVYAQEELSVEDETSTTENTYQICYNARIKGVDDIYQTAECDVEITLRANTFQKEGYHFIGWAWLVTSDRVEYEDEAVVTNLLDAKAGETKTLYAIWEINTYNIKFYSGAMELATATFTYDEEKALPAFNDFAIPMETPYEFHGWTTSTTSTTPEYLDAQTVLNLTSENNGYVNLYAIGVTEASVVYETEYSTAPEEQKITKYYNTYGNIWNQISIKLSYSLSADSHNFLYWELNGETYEGGEVITDKSGALVYNVTAKWQIKTFTIRWLNNDGKVLEIDEGVEYGVIPTYDGPTPTYHNPYAGISTFRDWGEEILPATKDTWYSAVYTTEYKIYRVTWVNYDGSQLATRQITYGYYPEYRRSTPTRPATAEFTYEFRCWTPTVTVVWRDETYTATYTEIKREYAVTWLNEDGTVLESSNYYYGDTPVYGGETPTKATDKQYSYTFSGWDKEISPVTGEVSYTATYNKTLQKYTVTWQNAGNILKTEQIDYGTLPQYSGQTPTKQSTVQYVFTFNGWSPEVVEVTGDATYSAVFAETLQTYTIVWKNHDDTIIITETGPYGSMPEFRGQTPTKPSDSQYNYTFSGWTPTLTAITGNAEYKAQFAENVNAYTITWKNGDVVLRTEKLAAGSTPIYTGPVPTKQATVQYTYTFSGWSPQVTEITQDTTYTAVFAENLRSYTIVWKNDKTTLKTESLTYGSTPNYDGETPTKQATAQYTYTFSGWSPEISTVVANTIYTAMFEAQLNMYEIKWVNEGTVIKTENVGYGTLPSYSGETPTKETTAQYFFVFCGWTPSVEKVTQSATYTATYDSVLRSYTIKWVNYDDSVLETDKAYYGENPEYNGEIPTKNTSLQYIYNFYEWSPEITQVSGDVVYKAQFMSEMRVFSIVWKNEERVLKSQLLKYGAVPEYDGETPTKAESAQFKYEFAGWSPEVVEVTANKVYYATFTQTLKSYTVNWLNYDGSVLETDTVEYGLMPEYNGETPTKEQNEGYSYAFKGWDKELTNVVEDVDYTATYAMNENIYTITWKNGDEVLKTDYLAFGSIPVYAGVTPTKTSEQYIYTFKGWSPDIICVCGDATYSAEFAQTARSYTVVWKNYDGTVLETEEVLYGITPVYSGKAPTKQATAQYTYTFNGWTPDLAQTTQNAEYVATFTETVNKYTITWKNGETVLKTENLEYGATPAYSGTAPTKESTAQFTYTFTGWTPEFETVTKNATYSAQFDEQVRMYTVKITPNREYWGTVSTNQLSVAYGTEIGVYKNTLVIGNTIVSANAGLATKEYTYDFIGWQHLPANNKVEEEIEIVAQFSQTGNTYKIIYKDEYAMAFTGYNQQTFESDHTYGEETVLSNGIREGYEFGGWYTNSTCTGEPITEIQSTTFNSDVVLYAKWTAKEYLITYSLYGGTAQNPTKYTIESDDISLIRPTREGYIFEGWTGSGITEKATRVTLKSGSKGNKVYIANWKPLIKVVASKQLPEDCNIVVSISLDGFNFDQALTVNQEYYLSNIPYGDLNIKYTVKIGEEEYATTNCNFEYTQETEPSSIVLDLFKENETYMCKVSANADQLTQGQLTLVPDATNNNQNNHTGLIIMIVVFVLAAGACVAIYVIKRAKNSF